MRLLTGGSRPHPGWKLKSPHEEGFLIFWLPFVDEVGKLFSSPIGTCLQRTLAKELLKEPGH
jgi:hypothetical protein